MKRINKRSIPQLVAEQMREDISNLVWTDKLPGYRNLMDHYQVSKVSCRTALQILENDGIITPAKPGQNRRITHQLGRVKKLQQRLLIISDPVNISQEDERLSIGKIEQHWGQQYGPVRHTHIDMKRVKQPFNYLQNLIDVNTPSCIIAHVPTAAWTRALRTTGLPFYLLGGEVDEQPMPPGNGYSRDKTLVRALKRLQTEGHTRVIVPTSVGWNELRASVVKSIRSVYHDQWTDEEAELFAPAIKEDTPDVWQDYIHTFIHTLKPTAVILRVAQELFALYSYCANHGIRIPEDLSIILEEDAEAAEWLRPEITRLRYPYPRAVKHCIDWIESDFTKRDFKFFEMEWVEGKSVAPPAKR